MITPEIKIIIADDHYLIREGFASFIGNTGIYKVVARASNGKELIELATVYHPDIIVTDIRMPCLNGIEATREIMRLKPGISVLGFSFLNSKHTIIEMLQAGAIGYISKCADFDEILEALINVHNKIPYCCSATKRTLGKDTISTICNQGLKVKSILTDQEKRVVIRIAKGMTTKEIAQELTVSSRTVDAHRRNILEKLRLKNVTSMLAYAIKHNLINIDEIVDNPN